MPIIAYHASHEQFSPSDLLKWSILAEQSGFQAINSSDHFHPWSERQGQSGFSWSWLGAAMQATRLPFGVVCAPGQRYHPAIIAQAGATLAQMFPQRLWISLGTGEALNERITGEKWPDKPERNERLKECVTIIKKLWDGETVTHKGLVTIEQAKLYTRAATKPLLLIAALSPETAAWAAPWADGLITAHAEHTVMKEIIQAFRKSGGENKPVYLKAQLSYDETDEAAYQGAYDQWRTNVFSGTVLGDLWKVEQFDALGEMVTEELLRQKIRISNDINQHIEWIRQDLTLGFEKIVLHNVNRNQERFIRDFGKSVLPVFK